MTGDLTGGGCSPVTGGGTGDFAAIVAAAQAGDERAIAELYRRLNPRLVRFLRARLGQDAEDVASATWIDVCRNLGSFAGDADGLAAFVFTIGRRRMLDHVRSAARRPATPVEAADLDGLAPSEGADAAADRGRLGDEAVRAMVAALPPDHAEIVLLRVVAGLGVDEVAAITGKRPGNVRVIQHRALRRLAEVLDDATVAADGDV